MGLLTIAKGLVDRGEAEELSTGSFDVHKVEIEGVPYVLKSCRKTNMSSRLQRRYLLSHLETRTGGLAYRIPPKEGSEVIGVEASVLKRWENAGILAPRVIAANGIDSLLLSFFDGEDLSRIVKEGRYSSELGRSLVQTIGRIRKEAYNANDPGLLHNDMWLANFMCLTGDQEVIPIDPGLLCKTNLELRELDAYVNLFFCYSLLGERFGYSPSTKDAHEDILGQFVSSLDDGTLARMKERNIPAHWAERAYLHLTGIFGFNKRYGSFVETFRPEKCAALAEYLTEN